MIKKLLVLFFCFVLNNAANAAPPPLEAYGRLPGVELMRLSSSGERYAFVAVIGENRRLLITSNKGEALLSTDVGKQKVRNIRWVGEDRVLVWISTAYSNPKLVHGTHEFEAVININLKTHKSFQIFDDVKQTTSFIFGYAGYARVSDHDYGYFVGIALDGSKHFSNDHRVLYRVDLDTGETKLFADGGRGPEFSWVVGLDGAVIAHSVHDSEKGIWRLYLGDGDTKLLLERKYSPLGGVELIGRGRTTGTVWIADQSSGATIIEEISLVDGKSETLFTDFSTNGYLNDPVSGLAIGATTIEEPHAIFFDKNLQARIKGARKAFPDLQMELISFSQNLDRLIVKTSGTNDSGTFWLVDIASGQADPIGHPYPAIRPPNVGPTQIISYKASDGLEIHAVLTLPPERKPENLPLVVLPHGGPIGVSDAVGFDWWAQAYASVGYAVLQPNYRGSGGNGRDFLVAGFGEWGRKMQTDLSDGVAALALQGIIDSKRVCIAGMSYGGYAALTGVTLQHDIYRCAVSVGGPTNLFLLFRPAILSPGNDITRYWQAVIGTDKEGDGLLKKLSPKYFAKQASAPILLIHGKDDTVVPVEQSVQMKAELSSADKSVDFIEMPSEDHWLSREETRQTMLKASVDFVRKYNPPD